MKQIAFKLNSCGKTISEAEICWQILMNLPDYYRTITCILKNQPASNLNLVQMTDALLEEENIIMDKKKNKTKFISRKNLENKTKIIGPIVTIFLVTFVIIKATKLMNVESKKELKKENHRTLQ